MVKDDGPIESHKLFFRCGNVSFSTAAQSGQGRQPKMVSSDAVLPRIRARRVLYFPAASESVGNQRIRSVAKWASLLALD